jgi:hypothetical protein
VYALIDDGLISFRRAAYAVERTVARLTAAGLSKRPLAVLSGLLRTGEVAA